jgi:hypothetical protein
VTTREQIIRTWNYFVESYEVTRRMQCEVVGLYATLPPCEQSKLHASMEKMVTSKDPCIQLSNILCECDLQGREVSQRECQGCQDLKLTLS